MLDIDKIIKLKIRTKKSKENARKLTLLADEIFKKVPSLFEILKESGNDSLLGYIKNAQQYQLLKLYQKRKSDFLNIVNKKIENIFGKETAKEAMLDIADQNYLPTSDHHGPCCHPFFNDSNLVNAFAAAKNNNFERKKLYLLTLASSSVSLDNSSYPRGFVFHAKDRQGNLEEHKMLLYPKRKFMSPIYSLPAFQKQQIELAKKDIIKKTNANILNEKISQRLLSIMDRIYNNSDILALPSYSAQISKTNYYLWEELFRQKENPLIRNFFLDDEDFIADLLISYHLKSNSPIAKLLFDKNARNYGMEIFDNIVGAYSSKDKKGTVFFWGIINQQRQQLIINNEMLVSPDLSIKIPLTPEAVEKALRQGLLMPNLLLIFLLLSGYYGMNCLGGFSQVDYLTVMMQRWRSFLEKIGQQEEAELNTSVPTKILYGDMSMSFLAANGHNNQLMPTSFMDLVIYKHSSILTDLTRAAERVTLAQSIVFNFPEFYRILYKPKEQKPELLTLSRVDIMDMLSEEDNNNFYILKI